VTSPGQKFLNTHPCTPPEEGRLFFGKIDFSKDTDQIPEPVWFRQAGPGTSISGEACVPGPIPGKGSVLYAMLTAFFRMN
jgi:hypothetical protein